jgi:hypothetical protein
MAYRNRFRRRGRYGSPRRATGRFGRSGRRYRGRGRRMRTPRPGRIGYRM